MEKISGIITKGLGGLYTVYSKEAENEYIECRAKGAFRHESISPLVGDRVLISQDGGYSICKICERKNELIRPAMANLDYMFIALSASYPAPNLCYIDKLTAICDTAGIEPVIIVTKTKEAPAFAKELFDIYKNSGFITFAIDKDDISSIDTLRDFIKGSLKGKIAAFAGASGVGKSTLLNSLFPSLYLKVGDLSEKISRGKHTTRHVELFSLDKLLYGSDENVTYLADTPGFTMLDFLHYDFLTLDELPSAFREYRKYLGKCRYTDCTHTKEKECRIVCDSENGILQKSRHESYLSLYNDLKNKHPWDK
ncbi:MAG: ribosome small subunit-dependent GTPase A [Clostridia bacterium]|nr:ribosome small subunit-dependent GTPase A [Clostridia bacterium]